MIGDFKDESQVAKLEELASREDSLYTDSAHRCARQDWHFISIGEVNWNRKAPRKHGRALHKSGSAQPVTEENPQGSLTYWHILNALGNLKSEQSFDFLLSAVQDFAPDKRQKALSSLVSVGKNLSLSPDKNAAMREHLVNAFKDPSTQVRQAAIESAALLGDPSLIEEVAAMTSARETSLWKEAQSRFEEPFSAGSQGQSADGIEQTAAGY